MNESALLQAFVLDGQGGGRRLSLEEAEAWSREDGLLWLHVDVQAEGVEDWLVERAGLDRVTAEALCAEAPRPRLLTMHQALLAVLRGVNVNPGADPEDMVSLRGCFEENRILTLRRQRVMAIQDLADSLDAGRGPTDVGGFLVEIVHCLLDRTGGIVDQLGDSVDEFEDRVLEEAGRELRPLIASLRRQAIMLRRYLAPQRDVLARLPHEKLAWLSDLDRAHLREEGERIARFVEDIEAYRERAAVTQEELSNRLAEQMNRTMYVLSMVAAVFLPLGLLTGLLGINVGGMPGTDSHWAFGVVTVGLVVLALILVFVLRRLRWL